MRVDSHISTARNHSVEHTTHNLHVRSIKNEDERDFPFIPKPDYDTPPEKVRLSEHLSPKPDLTLHLGKKIGRGGKGDVYENKFNPREVIKLFKESPSQKDVEHEVNCFCKCHGEGSASTIVSNGIVIGIKMRKIKGTPLNRLPSIPNKAKFKFESMIEEIESRGILHSDMTETNILYDHDKNTFNFIDITSYSKSYNEAKDRSAKKELLQQYAASRNYIIDYVNKKIK